MRRRGGGDPQPGASLSAEIITGLIISLMLTRQIAPILWHIVLSLHSGRCFIADMFVLIKSRAGTEADAGVN